MVPDIELNHWGLHSWGTGLNLKITFFSQTPAQVWFYKAARPLQLKSQQVTPQLSSHAAHKAFDGSAAAVLVSPEN